MNLIDFIKERAKEFRNKVFLWEGEIFLTYQEFDQVTDRMAAALQSLGMKKGDHTAVLFPNSIDTLLCYFSIIKAGGTAIPINPLYTPREIAFILNDSEARFLLAAGHFQKVIEGIQSQVPSLTLAIFRGEEDTSILKAVERRAPSGHPLRPLNLSSKDNGIIFYTSGTQGQPKGVMLTHGNFTFSGPNIARAYGLQEDDITMAVLPLVHVFAVASPVFGSLSSGGTVVILERFQLSQREIRPSDILTPEAFENAMKVHAAIGGSTNALLHLPAIAHELGIKIDGQRFDLLNRQIPYLTNIQPSGEYLTELFWYAGGIPRVQMELREVLDLNVVTVSGKTLRENLEVLEKEGFFRRGKDTWPILKSRGRR